MAVDMNHKTITILSASRFVFHFATVECDFYGRAMHAKLWVTQNIIDRTVSGTYN